ncbi:hypothetical protein DFJ73DRAFT_768807 [Zopfochytrium polystomum]|nr:hypothetical protein DFJ73DRAFT_768807 [Zopfochytrium polystomum]
MITATNIFGSSSCTTPLAIAGSSLSNTCTNSTVCTATQRSAIVVNTTTTCLAQPTSSDYAASVLGKSTYVGVVIYADVACSTEVASRFVIADGSCVAGPGTSYKATVGSGKGTFATYGTTDCSGNTASWDGPFVTTKCGSGASALNGLPGGRGGEYDRFECGASGGVVGWGDRVWLL